MADVLGWLSPFDIERPYAPRRIDVLHDVKCGDRSDYVWVRLDPAIAAAEVGNEEELRYVLLAPRHEGHPLIVPVAEPTHVYVATVRDARADCPSEIDPRQVEIRHWGIVGPPASG